METVLKASRFLGYSEDHYRQIVAFWCMMAAREAVREFYGRKVVEEETANAK